MIKIDLVKKFKRSFEIKMSPNGKFLSYNSSSSVALFNTETYEQIADFRDVKYASQIEFSSDSKLLAVKSNQRKIAIYDLEKLELIRLYRLRKNSQTQDDGFCFTNDCKYILNLVHTNELLGYISKIDIETLNEKKFFEESNCVFKYIEYVRERKQYLITGFERNGIGDKNTSFIMWYSDSDDSFERINLDLDIEILIYHEATKTFVVKEIDEYLKVFTNEFQFIEKIKIVSDRTEIFNFFDFIDESKGLRELFKDNRSELESEIEKLKIEFDEFFDMEISEDGYFYHTRFSRSGKYLVVVMSNIVKIYEYPTFNHVCSINHKYTCYAEFSYDDKHVLIGTWSNGYIYKLNI